MAVAYTFPKILKEKKEEKEEKKKEGDHVAGDHLVSDLEELFGKDEESKNARKEPEAHDPEELGSFYDPTEDEAEEEDETGEKKDKAEGEEEAGERKDEDESEGSGGGPALRMMGVWAPPRRRSRSPPGHQSRQSMRPTVFERTGVIWMKEVQVEEYNEVKENIDLALDKESEEWVPAEFGGEVHQITRRRHRDWEEEQLVPVEGGNVLVSECMPLVLNLRKNPVVKEGWLLKYLALDNTVKHVVFQVRAPRVTQDTFPEGEEPGGGRQAGSGGPPEPEGRPEGPRPTHWSQPTVTEPWKGRPGTAERGLRAVRVLEDEEEEDEEEEDLEEADDDDEELPEKEDEGKEAEDLLEEAKWLEAVEECKEPVEMESVYLF